MFALRNCLLVLAVLSILDVASGQTTTATILGTITDTTGAVVTGATVTVRHVTTGLVRAVTSDGSGNYLVSELPVGEYEVAVERAGFRKAVVSEVILEVDQKARVDVLLSVGQVSETVEVTAHAPLMKTDSADVGMVVDNKRVTDLPLNGRIYFQLNLLDSGTAQRTGWRTSIWTPVGGATYSFNGSPSDSNMYLVDGIMSQEMTVTHPSMKVTIDAIQEFKQEASQYGAEFGSGSGGQINLVTKSGTNSLHGSAWEFLRNSGVDARNFFASSTNPEFRQNQFGATIGGPIRKNKTFFFGSYEGTRIRKGIPRLFSVPPVAQRSGNFGGSNTVYDPYTTRPDPNNPANFVRDPFPGNVIPTSRIDPVAQNVLQTLFPLPLFPGNSSNLYAAPVQSTTEDQYIIRVDHQFNENNSVFGRFSSTDPRRTLPLTFSQLPNFADIWNQPAKNAVISYTRIFSPNTLNDFKVGFNRFIQVLEDFQHATDVDKSLGISRLDSRFGGNPTISIAGFNSTAGITNSPNNRTDNDYELVDSFSFTRKGHALGFGVNLQRIQANGGVQFAPRGIFTFTARYSALPGVSNTGASLADYLLGFPTQTQNGFGDGFRNFRHNQFGAYFKDDWHISPKLTFNLGLRYEYYGPWYEAHDRLTFLDFASGQVVSTKDLESRGYPRSSYFVDKLDFAPRFGFAYRPFSNNKTVLRGGYGIFYSFNQGYTLSFAGNPSAETQAFTFNANPITPNLTLANGFPPALALQSNSLWAYQTHWRTPYNQVWSFVVQREIAANLVLDIGYVGNKGSQLLGVQNINQPPLGPGTIASRSPYSQFSTISEIAHFGASTYHAFKGNAERRVGRSLSFRASYTWAKNLDVAGLGSFGESTETFQRNQFNPNADKGRSIYDARHRFVVSYTYEPPFGQGKRLLSNVKGVEGVLVNGWQINGITTLQTGTPVNLSLAQDVANSGGAGADNRPNVTGNSNSQAPHTVQQWFNTSVFTLPQQYTFGNAGKNIITAPGIVNFDISLFKRFAIVEKQTLEFRFEVFNVFNHPNFDPPNAVFGTAAFAKITSAGDGRDLQFSLKYIF